MRKLLRFGDHPQRRIMLGHAILHPKDVLKHYRECEDNCFPSMFYGEVLRRIGWLLFYGDLLGAVATGGRIAPLTYSFAMIIAGLCLLTARFARHTYAYEDLRLLETGNRGRQPNLQSVLAQEMKELKSKDGALKLPQEILDAIQRATGAVSVEQLDVSEQMVDGMPTTFGTVKVTKLVPKDEDPIERLIRESAEEARKKKGGGGPLPS